MHNRIALFRTERGASRRELGEAVGVNPQTIGFLERGDYNPSLELGLKLSRFFEVPVETLFSFDPFPSVASILANQESRS
ncbi:transcriptional regulator [Sphingomonas oligophenolica]|uniref:Transcriptional regulator n=1 Tax=Sphingomonas oligophenolica TaxID=301154 RepID=A0A502BTZ2_9SPHN|nr:transcriptional regulator [Sphingomonas oligophenolica]